MDFFSGQKKKEPKEKTSEAPYWVWFIVGLSVLFFILLFFLAGVPGSTAVKDGKNRFIGLEPLNPDNTNLKTEDFATQTVDPSTKTDDFGSESQDSNDFQFDDLNNKEDEIIPAGARKKKKFRFATKKRSTSEEIDTEIKKHSKSLSVSFFGETNDSESDEASISVTESDDKNTIAETVAAVIETNNACADVNIHSNLSTVDIQSVSGTGSAEQLRSHSRKKSRIERRMKSPKVNVNKESYQNNGVIRISNVPIIPQEILNLQTEQILKQEPKGTQKDVKWKKEAECKRILEKIYKKPFIGNARPDFLKNPFIKDRSKAQNLELDAYNEELAIALEYQGPTHYEWPNWTTESYDHFKKTILKDAFKAQKCNEMGIWLIPVPYNIPYGLLEKYILMNRRPDVSIS